MSRSQDPEYPVPSGADTDAEFSPGTEGRTQTAFIADALFKYQGTACTSEFCQRDVDGEPRVVEETGTVKAYEGWGLNTQISRMVGKKGFELVGRYSLVEPSARIRDLETRREEAWFGCTRYINQHRIKVQGALSYAWRSGVADFDHAGNKWGRWLQM